MVLAAHKNIFWHSTAITNTCKHVHHEKVGLRILIFLDNFCTFFRSCGTCFELVSKQIRQAEFKFNPSQCLTTTNAPLHLSFIHMSFCIFWLLELLVNRWSCKVCTYLMHWSLYTFWNHLCLGKDTHVFVWCVLRSWYNGHGVKHNWLIFELKKHMLKKNKRRAT